MGQLGRQFFFDEDRIRGANRDARAAVDALGGMDEKLRGFGEARFVFFWMNAVHRTCAHALIVLGTRINDYICHAVLLRETSPHISRVREELEKIT